MNELVKTDEVARWYGTKKWARIAVQHGVAEISGVPEAALAEILSSEPPLPRFDERTGCAVLERFYEPTERGTLLISPGLVPRVDKYLTRNGWGIEITDSRAPTGTMPWQAQVRARSMDPSELVLHLAGEDPRQRVLIVTQSGPAAYEVGEALRQEYTDDPNGRFVEEGLHSQHKRPGCTAIVTPEQFATADLTAWDAVIVAGVSTMLWLECRDGLTRLRLLQASGIATHCRVLCVHQEVVLDPFTQLVVEESFGPLLPGKPFTEHTEVGQAFLVEAPSVNQEPCGDAYAGGPVPNWLDPRRNARIAEVCDAIVQADYAKLAMFGLPADLALASAAVIVHKSEHALVLKHVLPDWHVDLDVSERVSHRATLDDDREIFLLMDKDYEGGLPAVDVLIHGSGGIAQLPDAFYDGSVATHLVDFYSRTPEGIDNDSHWRMLDLEQAGWEVHLDTDASSDG